MEEVLKFLKGNFEYLYPGFITIWLFYFIRGKSLKDSSNTIVKSIIVSYIYINLLPILNSIYVYIINKFKFKEILTLNTETCLFIISIVIPILICKLIHSSFTSIVLKILGIHTTVYANILDELKNRVNRNYYMSRILKKIIAKMDFKNILKKIIRKLHLKYFCRIILNLLKRFRRIIIVDKNNKAIALSVYLDNEGIMYYGWLAFHESDKDNEEVICLNKYKRYKLNDNKQYCIDVDYSVEQKRYVILKNKDITRVELVLKKDI
ncbi:MAG: hypothetical protein GX275_04855 [Clostridiales bacterium]|nr:hypothetical protein [Clostridiales bacterium]